MTNSTKIILKMVVGFAVLAGLSYVISLIKGAGGEDTFEDIAGVAIMIAGVCFIAFLVSLIVSSARGN